MKKLVFALSAALAAMSICAKPKVSNLAVTAYPDQQKIEISYKISGMSGNGCGTVGVTLTTMGVGDLQFDLMFAPYEGYGDNGTHTVVMDATTLSKGCGDCSDIYESLIERYPGKYLNYYVPDNDVDAFIYYLTQDIKKLDVVWVNVYDVCKSGDDYDENLFAYKDTDNIKVKKGSSSSSSTSSAAAAIYSKAMTKTGCVYDNVNENLYGTATIKFGKISKKGVVKVSASITPFSGKKLSASGSFTADENGDIYGPLKFKAPIGNLTLFAGKDEETGAFSFWIGNDSEGDGNYFIEESQVGGNLENGTTTFSVELDDFELPSEDFYIIEDLLPESTTVTVSKNGAKLTIAGKSPKVKFRRVKEDGDTYYEPSWEDGDWGNPASLKLTYKPKTGALSGSFKIYTTNWGNIDESKAPKVKAYTAKISGIVIDGYGSGFASLKIGKTTYSMPFFFGED